MPAKKTKEEDVKKVRGGNTSAMTKTKRRRRRRDRGGEEAEETEERRAQDGEGRQSKNYKYTYRMFGRFSEFYIFSGRARATPKINNEPYRSVCGRARAMPKINNKPYMSVCGRVRATPKIHTVRKVYGIPRNS